MIDRDRRVTEPSGWAITPASGLPGDLQEVSAEFLTGALRAGGVLGADATVAEVVVEQIAVGKALIGQVARLLLTYTGGTGVAEPPSVILKMPGTAEANRDVGNAFGHYLREGRFYRDLAPALPVRTPRCLWVHVEPSNHGSWLLLEDLSAWTAPCQIAGADAALADAAIAEIVRLHAHSWDAAPETQPGWLHRFDELPHTSLGQAYRAAWDPFVQRFGHLLTPEATALGRRTTEVFEQLQQAAAAEAPLGLCHGDFKLDNLLIDSVGAIAVLDWQVVHRGPAVQDVAMLLAQSLDVETRRRHERDLVRSWHAGLAAALGVAGAWDAYPFELAWDHYRRMVLFATAYPVVLAVMVDLQNDRGLALIEKMIHRSFAAAIDLDTGALLP